MKARCSVLLTLLMAFLMVSSARAIDEGQTQPKLSTQSLVFSTLSTDLIPLTNGSGNVKGVLCLSSSSVELSGVQLHFYVDGSSARTISLSSYPFLLDNTPNYHTDTIPMNIRFASSIRIGMQRYSTSAEVSCMASWALD